MVLNSREAKVVAANGYYDDSIAEIEEIMKELYVEHFTNEEELQRYRRNNFQVSVTS